MANNKNHQKNTIYTRNLEPLQEGYRLSNIVLYDRNEEEIDLHMIKGLKVCITIPTLSNRTFTNELSKLDLILKEFENIECFIISNEPVYTQTRLSKPCKFEKFNIISDFKKREYARNTGTYIYEISQLVKSILIIDRNDKIIYARYIDDLYSYFDHNEIHETLRKATES